MSQLALNKLCQLLCLFVNLQVLTIDNCQHRQYDTPMPARKAKNKALLTELGILIASAALLDPEQGGLTVAARVQISILQAHLKSEPLTVKPRAGPALVPKSRLTRLRIYQRKDFSAITWSQLLIKLGISGWGDGISSCRYRLVPQTECF